MNAILLTTTGTDDDTAAEAMNGFARTWWTQPRAVTDARYSNELGYALTFKVFGGLNIYGIKPADGAGWEVWQVA